MKTTDDIIKNDSYAESAKRQCRAAWDEYMYHECAESGYNKAASDAAWSEYMRLKPVCEAYKVDPFDDLDAMDRPHNWPKKEASNDN